MSSIREDIEKIVRKRHGTTAKKLDELTKYVEEVFGSTLPEDHIEENFWDDRTTPGAYNQSDSERDIAERRKFRKIALEVQREWQMGGLADTIYEKYAWEIYKKMKGTNETIPVPDQIPGKSS